MDEKPFDPFTVILEVMDTEHLIRFRRRCEKRGKLEMVQILTEEIKRREAVWTDER